MHRVIGIYTPELIAFLNDIADLIDEFNEVNNNASPTKFNRRSGSPTKQSPHKRKKDQIVNQAGDYFPSVFGHFQVMTLSIYYYYTFIT